MNSNACLRSITGYYALFSFAKFAQLINRESVVVPKSVSILVFSQRLMVVVGNEVPMLGTV